ncbi:1-phosphatidylinositol 4,5-bisphosphate phosphodiesterase gamma-1 isoform X2 [Sabethes cyaneus]|uniref:1-phosphatidylinositol 4,5-bisphosphate phosphodiesterase gamma-1 isoform X2 n=1 Tax=Sabethes cyaneus TaxID=53552 RepID=UPI00237E95BB|nr:1-phosphatidylinositol 4,5-bisphosphate phosphodiesterase gamma-1 isoform X2 [Sabethes cyaneus]
MSFSFGLPALGEMEQIICSLERGTLIQKFYARRKPEKKTLMLHRETRQVTWSSPGQNSRSNFEGAFELREVKEVRLGKASKDFEKWADEAKKIDLRKCFVVFYGNEFKLRSLSVVALSEKECEMWIKGLKHMIADTLNAPYWLKVERWLRREFYAMENSREAVSLKEVKSFLPKVNCKITTAKLNEIFNEVDTRRRIELGFDDFVRLYQKLMTAPNSIHEYIESNMLHSQNEIVTLQEFQNFLNEVQNESLIAEAVSNVIREYVQDPVRDVQEPYMKIQEFIDFLFSRQNEIWNKKCDTIYQDMNRPLAHYWISSSHNTYLTGDQFSSESSVEAYARALRMGCRCIELDCWDGPDNMPLIFHGHTFTTKIKFKDVIQTIKEHAFVTSEYPVILSIEQNCSLAQQRKMACAMQDIFGDMLLTQQIEKNELQLPSPSQLKRKIILKHKKLPENGGKLEDGIIPNDGALIRTDETELDIRNTVKNGILFLEDPVDKVWNPHFFVLTEHKLFYTDSQRTEREDMREEECDSSLSRPKDGVTNDELHFGENWFHGKLPGGREEAESLLRQYAHFGDGTFLVRESVTFVGDYCLSFWRQGKPNHCRIKLKQDKGVTKYYLMENNLFDNLYSLIIFYRQNSLRSSEFYITLKEPVPQPNKHESKDWYHENTTREQSEIILHQLHNDGAFLVRPSDKGPNAFVISFRANNKIKHCRIKVEGRLYSVGGMEFESLIDLVNFYIKHPLYKKVKLTHPISRDMMKKINTMNAPDDNGAYSYMDPSSMNEKITVKALYDYKAQRDDELSFCKHAIITNVDKKGNELWWTGNYGGKKQHYFPANYVQEINTTDGNSDDSGSDSLMLGSLQKGSLDVHGAVVELTYGPHPELERILRIQNPSMQNVFEIGVQSKELAIEWMNSIKQAAQNASVLEDERRKMERNSRVAKEMSDMIIYCRSVPFKNTGWVFYEMSSFPETKAEKYFLQQETKLFVRYHRSQISRVYPKGQRLDSSNYNPIPLWNTGSQMIALNFQTPDKAMQLNQAKFRDNGACGYILKPQFMFRDEFDLNDPNTVVDVEEKVITIRIIGARHLCKGGRNITSPLVEVEILGANFDNGVKHRTKAVADNGFNPFWKEVCEFKVKNPDFAMLRFEVQDEDMFGEPNFIGQAVFPINALRTGYRSVPLRNKYSEELELATLLVHIVIRCSSNQGDPHSDVAGVGIDQHAGT